MVLALPAAGNGDGDLAVPAIDRHERDHVLGARAFQDARLRLRRVAHVDSDHRPHQPRLDAGVGVHGGPCRAACRCLQGRWRWAPWRGSNPGADLKGGGLGALAPLHVVH